MNHTNGLEQSLLEVGLVEGHFVLASGLHSTEKFDFDKVPDGYLLERVAAELGEIVVANYPDCDSIATVGNGANRLSEPVAIKASEGLQGNIQAVRTYKPDGYTFEFPDSCDVLGRKVVIVDDVFTRGTNVRKVARLLGEAGADLLGSAVVLNRSVDPAPKIETDYGELAVLSLIHHPITDYPPESCPHDDCVIM